MRAFGGMISADLKGDLDDAKRFLERCRLFALAESLGGVESLIEHPALMTARLGAAGRARDARHRRYAWCGCRSASRMPTI